jgi:hypothetical protein
MAAPRNMLSGYAEPAHINDFMFEQQRRTFATYGKVAIRFTQFGFIRSVTAHAVIYFIFWLSKFISLESLKRGSIPSYSYL